MNKIVTAHAVFLVLFMLVPPPHAMGAPATKQDDVVVKKNADGSVEASDAKSAPAAAPQVQYHLHNPVGTRRIDGVTIRTNPDGSIETVDNDSPAPARRATRRATASTHTHKTTKTAAKKQH